MPGMGFPTRLAALIGAAWLAACAPADSPMPQAGPAPLAGPPGSGRTIHVVSNGWHAGIVVARDDLPHGKLPEAADFPDSGFVEIGWGDREYYTAPSPTLGAALAAGLGANPSVIHLVGLPLVPRPTADLEVVRLTLTGPGFAAMIDRIDAAFDRGAGARAERVAPGLAPQAGFYAAQGRFSLANTCNTWVARKLAAGGVAVSPAGVVTAGQLMERLRAARDADPGRAESAHRPSNEPALEPRPAIL